MAGDYHSVSAALKLQLTDNFSFGLILISHLVLKQTIKTALLPLILQVMMAPG